jgi:hypothetical protein
MEITPERYVDNCSEAELRETALLVESRLNKFFDRGKAMKEEKHPLPLTAASDRPEPPQTNIPATAVAGKEVRPPAGIKKMDGSGYCTPDTAKGFRNGR